MFHIQIKAQWDVDMGGSVFMRSFHGGRTLCSVASGCCLTSVTWLKRTFPPCAKLATLDIKSSPQSLQHSAQLRAAHLHINLWYGTSFYIGPRTPWLGCVARARPPPRAGLKCHHADADWQASLRDWKWQKTCLDRRLWICCKKFLGKEKKTTKKKGCFVFCFCFFLNLWFIYTCGAPAAPTSTASCGFEEDATWKGTVCVSSFSWEMEKTQISQRKEGRPCLNNDSRQEIRGEFRRGTAFHKSNIEWLL